MSEEKPTLLAGQPKTMKVSESDFNITAPTSFQFTKEQARKVRRHAIIAAEEMLRRPTEFPLDEAQTKAAKRIRMNSSRDRWKLLKLRDVAVIARLGRLNRLIPDD